jgi:hypothetical protein
VNLRLRSAPACSSSVTVCAVLAMARGSGMFSSVQLPPHRHRGGTQLALHPEAECGKDGQESPPLPSALHVPPDPRHIAL